DEASTSGIANGSVKAPSSNGATPAARRTRSGSCNPSSSPSPTALASTFFSAAAPNRFCCWPTKSSRCLTSRRKKSCPAFRKALTASKSTTPVTPGMARRCRASALCRTGSCNSGTMINMFEAFLQARGWDRGWQLLTEIAGNTRKVDRISSTTAKDVTLGETAYAFAIDFYALTQIAVAGRSNMTFALPQDFTAISPDGIAILKGAPNRAVAQRFIDFVLSEEGQKLWFLQRGNP